MSKLSMIKRWIWDRIVRKWFWNEVKEVMKTQNQGEYIKDMLCGKLKNQ